MNNSLFEISITNNGMGINRQQMKHLFRFTGGRSKSGAQGDLGTSLDLQICSECRRLRHQYRR